MLPSLDRRSRSRLDAHRWWPLVAGCLSLAVAGLVLLFAVGGARPAAVALGPLLLIPMPGSMVVPAVGQPAGWLIGLGLAVAAGAVALVLGRRRRSSAR